MIPGTGGAAHFVRLANEHGHQLVYHPASEDDISRDTDSVRRGQTVERLKQYIRLQVRSCNAQTTSFCSANVMNTIPLQILCADRLEVELTLDIFRCKLAR